jgi:hypothetical protein
MTVTPSARSSFLAGIGLWILAWAALLKTDEIAELAGIQHWVSSDRCLRWINSHKSTSLLLTEIVNFGIQGVRDPLGVTFSLGGTLVNLLAIGVFVPVRERLRRGRSLSQLG